MNGNPVIFGLFIIFIVLGLMFLRAKQVLETWAGDNGYIILSSDLRFLNRGPYSWTLLGKQWVFHVVVRTNNGATKTGYVKCGSFFWGVMVNKSEVEWGE